MISFFHSPVVLTVFLRALLWYDYLWSHPESRMTRVTVRPSTAVRETVKLQASGLQGDATLDSLSRGFEVRFFSSVWLDHAAKS